jgi:hypothetical protein
MKKAIFLLLLLIGCKMDKQVKKTISYKGLVIKLYEVDLKKIGQQKVRNIETYDSTGKLLWQVEAPTFDRYYFDMQIDEGNNELEGNSGYGYVYSISLIDGHILKSKFIK